MSTQLPKITGSLFLAGFIMLAWMSPLAAQTDAGEEGRNILYWVGCGISKKAYMNDLARAYERATGNIIKVSGGGSTKGIRDTGAGKSDIGGTCRPPLPFNVAEARVTSHPIAWDALVAITHPSNPVKSIDHEQLKRVLTGEVTNWKELGGPDRPIHLYARTGYYSGVGFTLRKALFGGQTVDFPTAKLMASTGPIEKAVESDPYALAVSGVSSARLRKVKILALDGVEPTVENIKSGDYMMYRPLYLVVAVRRGNDPVIKDFIRFARSDTAKKILIKNGVVPYLEAMNLASKTVYYMGH